MTTAWRLGLMSTSCAVDVQVLKVRLELVVLSLKVEKSLRDREEDEKGKKAGGQDSAHACSGAHGNRVRRGRAGRERLEDQVLRRELPRAHARDLHARSPLPENTSAASAAARRRNSTIAKPESRLGGKP